MEVHLLEEETFKMVTDLHLLELLYFIRNDEIPLCADIPAMIARFLCLSRDKLFYFH